MERQNLYHRVCHELRNGLFIPSNPLHRHNTNKVEIHEKTSIMESASTQRELMATTCNIFGALQSNKDFLAPLAWVNKIKLKF